MTDQQRAPRWPAGREEEGLARLAEYAIAQRDFWRRLATQQSFVFSIAIVIIAVVAPLWVCVSMTIAIFIHVVICQIHLRRVARMPLLWHDGSLAPKPPEMRKP